jgi:N-hydroxyarylamine O-acetyltransferase
MSEFTFNKKEYLNRINYAGEVEHSFACLKALRQAQHRNIPFENFTLCLGQKIALEPSTLFQKMVKHKRGGYCFELNGLFLMALKAFDFDARALLGRVHVTGEPTGKGHQVTIVTINDKQWIVDLGFGSRTPTVPVPFVYDEPITFQYQTFRIIKSDLYGNMLQGRLAGEWEDLYSFHLNPVYSGDIDYGNHYTSTSPNSFFTSSRVATLPIENGMLSLLNFSFKKLENGTEEITELEDDPSYLSFIQQTFGIELDATYENLKPIEEPGVKKT